MCSSVFLPIAPHPFRREMLVTESRPENAKRAKNTKHTNEDRKWLGCERYWKIVMS